jgi:hypothetical protein
MNYMDQLKAARDKASKTRVSAIADYRAAYKKL